MLLHAGRSKRRTRTTQHAEDVCRCLVVMMVWMCDPVQAYVPSLNMVRNALVPENTKQEKTAGVCA